MHPTQAQTYNDNMATKILTGMLVMILKICNDLGITENMTILLFILRQ